jgi:preprotein translocase subunit YajC
MEYTWILAQADTNQAPSRIGSQPLTEEGQTTTSTTVAADVNEVGPGGRGQGSGFPIQFIFLAVIFVFMYLFMLRGPRKQQQKHKQMVQTLAKNDRVRTIGGIFGTIVDVKGDEVTLKVDESNNTKIKVSTSAIGKNLTQEGKE